MHNYNWESFVDEYQRRKSAEAQEAEAQKRKLDEQQRMYQLEVKRGAEAFINHLQEELLIHRGEWIYYYSTGNTVMYDTKRLNFPGDSVEYAISHMLPPFITFTKEVEECIVMCYSFRVTL